MRKNNGSNGIPAWVKMDLQMLKRVSASLVDTVRETRLEMAEMHRDNQRRFSENEKMIARLDEQTASLKRTSNIHFKAILKLLKKI